MQKKQIMEHWQGLKASQAIQPRVIPYKHQGSTFAEDSIRITGTSEFIDSVLSRLKDMLAFENGETRLQLVYQPSKDIKTGVPTGSMTCYIQVHERGGEAKIANAIASNLAGGQVIVSKGY